MASVLVADDDADIRELLDLILRQAGHDVEVAADGVQAWVRLQLGGLDVVLLDIDMPRMSGLDVLHRIRATPGLDGLEVVLVSSLATYRDVERGLAAGAASYLTKPFRISDVVDSLARLATPPAAPPASPGPTATERPPTSPS